MALWTDAPFITENDLKALDREITNVAAVEDIPLSGPNGVIARGIAEAALEIQSEALQSFQSYFAPQGVPWNHYLAVANVGSGSPYGNTVRLHLGQIVVDAGTYGTVGAVKNFVLYHVLLAFYSSAMTRKEPDRYEAKYQRLEQRMDFSVRPFLFSNGLPCVATPLSCPGATGEPNSGTWAVANLSGVAGGATATPQPVDVAITYTGANYTAADAKNSESGPSERLRFTIPANQLLRVDITSLVPPTGTQPQSLAYLGSLSPMKATGWNVYVGARNGGLMFLQNAESIPVATKTYTLAGDPVLSGKIMGSGQFPDTAFTISKTMARG